MQNRPRSNQPRRMTRQQYEALQRQKRQNIIAIAVIAAIAILIVTAVILILRPHGTPDAVTALNAVNADPPVQSVETQPTAAPAAPAQNGGVDLAAQIEGDPGQTETSQAAAPSEETAAQPEPVAEPTPVPPIPQAVDSVTTTPRPDGALRSVRMRVVGDIMFCQSQLVFAKDSGYDFHNQFELVADQLANADYTMGNMEGTIGKYNTSN